MKRINLDCEPASVLRLLTLDPTAHKLQRAYAALTLASRALRLARRIEDAVEAERSAVIIYGELPKSLRW